MKQLITSLKPNKRKVMATLLFALFLLAALALAFAFAKTTATVQISMWALGGLLVLFVYARLSYWEGML